MHVIDPLELISSVGSKAAFKLTCDTNRIHEDAETQVSLSYVHKTLVDALNSRMYAENWTTLIINSDPTNNTWSRSY